jgi:hypothetical protein
MFFSPIRIILMAIGAAVGLVVVLAVVVLAAAFAGDPGECDSGDRQVESSPALADQLQAKLDGLQAQLDAGEAASITFDESEATSRASRFLDEKNAPISGLRICLNPDGPSASGGLDAVLGLDVTAKVSGHIFLDTEHPRVEDVDIDVGAVPGFAAGGFEGAVEDVINDQLEHISLDHQLTITFGEGTATLSGQP